MSTKFFNRPAAAYTGEAGLTNRTKYNDDSTASPRRPISSTKVDGDINYLIDAVNALYDTAVSGVVADASITNAKLRNSGACSVIGRSANTSGVPADILATNNDTVLVRKSNVVSFSTVPTAGIEDAAITTVKIADTNVSFAKIQNVNTATLVGRSSSGTGSVESLTVGSGLTLSGGALSANALTTAGLPSGVGYAFNSVVKSDSFTTTSTSWTDVTGVTLSITPLSSSDKVLVRAVLQCASAASQSFVKLVRGSTDIGIGDAAGTRTQASASVGIAEGFATQTVVVEFLDSPATTSSTTYKIQARVNAGGTFLLNRCASDSDSATRPTTSSTLSLECKKV
jgi:hypothetical protein